MPKVLVSDKLSPAGVQIFKDRGIEVDVKTGMSPEELTKCIGEYDGLVIRSATKPNDEIIKAATNLKVIGRAGIGVDNVDITSATQNGVIVMNTPFGNAITTAEHAISMMMALARSIPQANASTHAGKWEKSKFMGVELYSKTLGVIGCGNIGSIAADRGIGLKMKVIAADPYMSQERADELGVEKVELDELYARSDFITMHTPLTDTTKGIINRETIAKMKDGVRIINCARGGLFIWEDVKAAVETGKIGGVAVDVYDKEPAKENILFGMEQVICTPHLGASTKQAQENVALQVAEQISDYLLTGAITNSINVASVSAEDAPKLKPYIKLCEQLGALAGQVTMSGIKEITIDYEGHVAELNVKPLTAVVLQGLLSPQLNSVNMVNAPVIAKERGIKVTEAITEKCKGFDTVVRLNVTTENRTRRISGTLFAGNMPRIVEINDVPVEAELGKDMLYVVNEDRAGFIGTLGVELGEAGINIATFHLGRVAKGGAAIALLQLDSPVDGNVVEKILKLPNVIQATSLKF
ncbi:MAG: phosphoglycerate dehydrogenase [Alphaproteobacteria bacterium]|nr:phosphoglycerate dehydrogenase [Alphaproteobacteria bacterium]